MNLPDPASPDEIETLPTQCEAPVSQAVPSKRRRWSWKRWLANLMIVAGLVLLAYPLSTWGYTWHEQRALREQLTQNNPQLLAAGATLAAADLVDVDVTTDSTQHTSASTITTDLEATQAAAETEHQKELASFKNAADKFAASVGGRTGEPLGEIIIPSIGLNVVMVEGTGKGDLREGPGHWPETPFPGQGGNFVVSGHRTTYGAPFLRLNKIEVGDEIDLLLPYCVARYSVTRVIIVDPDEVQEVAQLGREQISLAACHPLYSANQRIVVQGDLIGFNLFGSES